MFEINDFHIACYSIAVTKNKKKRSNMSMS
jgi:hypothetical protein